MPATAFVCPKCARPLEVPAGTEHLEGHCAYCQTEFEAIFFPAFQRSPQVGTAAAMLVDQSEASCFYHPQKQASGVCDGCGRLICALCSVDMGSRHLCPSCISSGKKKGKITTLENSRTRYDGIALTLAALSIFLYMLSFLLAPAAIYIAIRHWNSPGSVLGVSKTRFVVAIVLSCLSLLGWGVVFYFMIHPPRSH